jgi:hemoglobin
MSETLYSRLGGYDAIAAVTDDLLRRLKADPKLERFWKNRETGSMHANLRPFAT